MNINVQDQTGALATQQSADPGQMQVQQSQQQVQQQAQPQVQPQYSTSYTLAEDRCQEYVDMLFTLECDLNQVMKDLAGARDRGEATGSIYAEKQRLDDEIRKTGREYEKCKSGSPTQNKPDLTSRQMIIGSSSVRRKDTNALSSDDHLKK